MDQPACSISTLRGTYAISYIGFITTASGPTYVTILGVVSIDPAESPNISGAITFTGFGPMFVLVSGTAQVNSDCTGTLRLGNPGVPPTELDQIIYDRDSKSLLATSVHVAAGNVASLGTWKRISAKPHAATWSAPPKL
jgi:hypothetical protein